MLLLILSFATKWLFFGFVEFTRLSWTSLFAEIGSNACIGGEVVSSFHDVVARRNRESLRLILGIRCLRTKQMIYLYGNTLRDIVAIVNGWLERHRAVKLQREITRLRGLFCVDYRMESMPAQVQLVYDGAVFYIAVLLHFFVYGGPPGPNSVADGQDTVGGGSGYNPKHPGPGDWCQGGSQGNGWTGGDSIVFGVGIPGKAPSHSVCL